MCILEFGHRQNVAEQLSSEPNATGADESDLDGYNVSSSFSLLDQTSAL